ncbi:hydroxyisourate hydrolase [Conidiobolus coronatus NRRL 28638]|uniref:5-hydroxyisourate hydrolase n=1 Tax=Conidiobolus coronatus (strain ATCC 28846 / CBS 209.66 / NRRL 28638) TaxID=796925 RepID=A0A137NWA4_CONC2|nr:hydroxyisourate hydrolase [Conidiobolus coronatus NRRL 28638]|eukprot:KXN66968.1 hydroxyisourate hydrolase [Conidiobolus coronatus NRRL 28638]
MFKNNGGPISTHCLDQELGAPCSGVSAKLFRRKNCDLEDNDIGFNPTDWELLSEKVTNKDGRIDFLPNQNYTLKFGAYFIQFSTQKYFKDANRSTFYPKIVLEFIVDKEMHYHVPLLISGYGFSTYRGS